MDYFDSENIDFQQRSELLHDLVFRYTGEMKSKRDNNYSCFEFMQPDENGGC